MINGKSLDEVMKALAEPFVAEDIEWRVGSANKDKTKGIALAYVTNRAIMNRLDEVVGCFNWQNTFKEWKGTSQICGIGIRVKDESEEWVWKWDGADDSNTEAVKGGLSDSMKRAGYQWGIGRYLYKLENVWVDLDAYKKMKTTPKLPSWALPKGSAQQANNSAPQRQEAPTPTVTHTPSTTQATPQENASTGTSERQKQRAKVYYALVNAGVTQEKANEWIQQQRDAKVDYPEMMKKIQTKKASK